MSRSQAIMARFLALHPKKIDLSLDRMRRILPRIGDPQRRLPPVIHVAGTNGKGSTVAFLRAMLEASGRGVHVYTSPHLVRFHERIRLGAAGGGRLVSEDMLADAFQRCEAANGADPITVFEITTAAALLLFAEHPADVLLLEVGLGGRVDATNVVERPAASVITPVSLDHMEYLGDTIGKIAFEKAGILKAGAPVIAAPQSEEGLAVIEATARAVRAGPLLVGGQDFTSFGERGRLVYQDATALLDLPPPGLVGRHQHLNAGTAIATLRAVFGASFPEAAIARGLENVVWPGRLQRLTGDAATEAPAGAEVWLDGGHNADGGRVLAEAMADLEARDPRPLVMIAGMLATKDSAAFLGHFSGRAESLVAVGIAGQDVARPAAEVAAIAAGVGIPAAGAAGLAQAFAAIRARRWRRPPRILICGSLYLAGEALAFDGSPPV
jgi:dihydrofolate synthase/folylpolyglutamate synthase